MASPSSAHPNGYESLTLPFAIDRSVPHTISARYSIARYREIARMTVRFRMRPLGVDVLQDLVRSEDLAASAVDLVPTFTLHGAAVEWRPDEPALRSWLPDDLVCPSGSYSTGSMYAQKPAMQLFGKALPAGGQQSASVVQRSSRLEQVCFIGEQVPTGSSNSPAGSLV